MKAVYDLTIAYQKGRTWQRCPEFWETLSVPGLSEGAEGYRFEVNVRRWPLEGLPEDEAGLVKWIEQRWVEKGEWLDKKRAEWADAEEKKGK